MRHRVLHTTHYSYSEPVSLCQNQARLTPRSFGRQTCLDCKLVISPEPTVRRSHRDFFGNIVTYLALFEPHTSLKVSAQSIVSLAPAAWPNPELTLPWERARDLARRPDSADSLLAAQFIYPSLFVPALPETLDYARQSFGPKRPLLTALLELTERIHRDFRFDSRATTINTPVLEVMEKRRGVCQDFAHLQLSCLRGMGLSARYVSGYLLTDPPPGQPRLIGADASHAWISVYCPGFGWVDLDPTNNSMPDLRHITVAWGRDYSDVCPLQGVYTGGGQHTLRVEVDVSPTPDGVPADIP